MPNRNNVWANIDWITVSIYLAMMLIGWINIYAAVYNEEHKSIFDMTQQYGKQLMWIGAALFIAMLMINTDSKFFVAFAFPIYILILVLLLVVPIIGTEINGAKSWIRIGSFLLQPSEFMKMGTSLALARYISSYNFKMHNYKSLLILTGIILIPVVLIFLQNDTGSAIVFGVFLLVLYREGLNGIVLFFSFLIALVFILTMVLDPMITVIILTVAALVVNYLMKKKVQRTLVAAGVFVGVFAALYLINYLLNGSIDPLYFLLIAAVVTSSLSFIWAYVLRKRSLMIMIAIYFGSVLFAVSVDYVFDNIMEQHQRDRINELLGIQSDIHGAGYHVNQSKIAIGSGGSVWKRLFAGHANQIRFCTRTKYRLYFLYSWGGMGIFGNSNCNWTFYGVADAINFSGRAQPITIQPGLRILCGGYPIFPLCRQHWYDHRPGAGDWNSPALL